MPIYYFGFKRTAVPTDMPVYDVRDITNPFNQADSDIEREALVLAHPLALELVNAICAKVRLSNLTELAIGCTWGKHRSKAIATMAAKFLGMEALPLSERPNATRSLR